MPDDKLAAALARELAWGDQLAAGFNGSEAVIRSGARLWDAIAGNDPAPVPGVPDGPPKPPTMVAMLEQDVWWWPNGKPPVRIASMDKPWRLNTVRFLERRAADMQLADHMSMFTGGGLLGPPPDDVAADLLAETSLHWLRRQPLMRALRKGLPTGGAPLRRLEARAVHWNTCPMRLAHPGYRDRCVCVQDDAGRTVGATNDPASVTA